ncbi:iron uptake porin [Mastigocoleus sp. MO_188.B34]|uniref:iron uptake porin n=1 Tax=Mastigocoleus sp. MO_188.B34 TaxID=3036635 RepID=UPI002602620A|nr:iron uptake porin [Mastigocoleus sp. MO_188.B34]MDJ0696481.1 iron uptake porin [Mastigocoleus sp. MO_188.B34]
MYKYYLVEWMSAISPKFVSQKFVPQKFISPEFVSKKFLTQKSISNKITRLIQVFIVTSLITSAGHANLAALEIEKISQVDYDRKKISQSDRNNRENNPGNSKQKLTPVSQLSDIQPGDWAFSALESLNRRYNCLVGYPDGTYRGNRPLTRYEFAAGLRSCLDKINEFIATNTAEAIRKEDLATLQRLQKDFAPELIAVTGRIDNLEAKTAELEANQFSTTVKLSGEVIFALSGAFGEERADDSDEDIDDNITLGSRTRLRFTTSFTGRDRLRLRLQARDTARLERATGTNMARLGFQGDNDNEVDLTELEYRFRVGRKLRMRIQARGGGIDDFTRELNPLIGDLQDSGTGATSRFGRRNPILRQGGDAGIGASYRFSDSFRLGLGFTIDDADDPDSGITRSPYGAIVNLSFVPNRRFGMGFTYVRSFDSLDTNTGSRRADDPFDDFSESIIANSYGAEVTFSPSRNFTIGSWVGFTQATAKDLPGNPNAEIFNYAISFAWADVGKEGNVAGLIVGQPPKVMNNDFRIGGGEFKDPDTSLHLEGFYTHRVNDNLSITPGLFVILNPEHNDDNDTIYVGTIRMTLEF